MPQQRPNADALQTHLARHDEQISALLDNTTKLEHTVGTLAETVSRGLTELSSKIESVAKPQPQLYLMAAGIAVAVMSLMLTAVSLVGGVIIHGVGANQSRIEESLSALNTSFIAHTSNGHPQSVVDSVKTNSEHIKDMDEKLQREMRLINDTTTGGLDSLDKRIQQEIQNIQNNLIERSQNNRRAIEQLEERLYNSSKHGGGP